MSKNVASGRFSKVPKSRASALPRLRGADHIDLPGMRLRLWVQRFGVLLGLGNLILGALPLCASVFTQEQGLQRVQGG